MPQRRSDQREQLERLVGLSLDQDSVVSRRQLRALGFDRHAVRRQIAAQRWQVVGPNVVVLHRGLLSFRQRQWVAVLHSGHRAALCGLSAAHVEGLAGFESTVVHTAVPHGHEAADLNHKLVQVRVRQSRILFPNEIHPVRQPPRERLPSAIVTSAACASTDERARLLVISAIQQRLLRPAELRSVLARRTKLRRRGLIIETIDDAEGGVHSLPEAEWLSLMRRARLPRASRQQRVRRPTGTWYLDCDFDVYQVSVEINGAQHEALLLAESDNERRNVLGIGGRLVITLSSYAVRHDPDTCVAVVAAALMSRGWAPGSTCRAQLQEVADRAGVDLRSGDRMR